ncbi:MAG: hypothetical protein IK111_10195 [Lachnospiraceae bacterium]|nr:hypothetical protein [Lachnospiraceae bacterium]
MNKFECDESYKADMKEYMEKIVEKYGISSQSAEREIMCMADMGNKVAAKLYADMVFYKKILRRNPYKEAFALYLRSADIKISDNGSFISSVKSYPLSFWNIAYYLINYRKASFLEKCESIEIIDAMSYTERLKAAIELSSACITYVDAPGAVNLIGRILLEAGNDEDKYTALKPVLQRCITEREFDRISLRTGDISCREDCLREADNFFTVAAAAGYVYACNNLAAREAGNIIRLDAAGGDKEEIGEAVERYKEYLRLSADKYEPYAANRLGLFYMTGDIEANGQKVTYRDHIDQALAKEYFKKATQYPDANSAWAFFNLIKYFHKDYDTNIELMNEHMDYIKMLNGKVYDLAMEL